MAGGNNGIYNMTSDYRVSGRLEAKYDISAISICRRGRRKVTMLASGRLHPSARAYRVQDCDAHCHLSVAPLGILTCRSRGASSLAKDPFLTRFAPAKTTHIHSRREYEHLSTRLLITLLDRPLSEAALETALTVRVSLKSGNERPSLRTSWAL